MTTERSFKRLVRARMGKTGESYTAARRVLLAAVDGPAPGEPPTLVTSDAEIRRRSGRGWEQWFEWLDERHADQLSHRDIARLVAAELEIAPLVWEAQAVTISYERSRGMRVVGQRADGFAVSATRTVAVGVEELFAAVAEPTRRARWLPEDHLTERTATRPTSIRFDWEDGRTRVHVTLVAKGAHKSTVTLEHARLADADEAARMKALWRAGLTTLKAQLEGGPS